MRKPIPMIASLLTAGSLLAAGAPATTSRFDRLMEDFWQHTLRQSPEFATVVGDPRYNHRLTDYSEPALQADLAWKRRFLDKLNALPQIALSEDQRLSLDLLKEVLQSQFDAAEWRPWEQPLNQMDGLHIDFPQLFSSQPFKTSRDFQNYLARLKAFPKAVDDTIANMRSGIAHHQVPPRLVVEATLAQVKNLSHGDSAREPFLLPLKALPAAFPEAQKRRICKAVAAAIDRTVTPAYARLARFIAAEYLPAGRLEPGLGSVEKGEARYRERIHFHTTTRLDARTIHATGLKEVARIEGEMAAIGQRLGFADLTAFRAAIAQKQDLHPKDGTELVARYKGYVDRMSSELPKLFGRLPNAPLAVIPMESFREEGAAAADYNAGTPDGSRPGRFAVNTFKAETRTMLTCESTAYHEAIPGHHMQISIAQELTGVPEFQKHAPFTAFEEGWALYSERLPKELGFYQDPYSDYGRLNDEMLRAIRLVLDTGVHALRWTRPQMVDFFRAHGSMDEVDIQSETDRYIAWPGQALAYKIGQMKILELREKAKAKLGPHFDIKGFHDCVLGGGALPLDLLERRVDAWIAQTLAPH